ncbi:AAA family ATPase [Vibrio astriarenae]|uniref:Chromosome partitioning protein ParA n=1 Tax=Vibrio agarivorans TaxID=153622 RepID=A0ABT7Y6R4_9VIBR|nr:chromosome partitioning protein ParA [Vibrio agarivorans]MDN2483729.1 chromosome partitioning protein ParA [Vibrio agarivorans]
MGTKEPMFDILESFNSMDNKAKTSFKMPCVVFTQTDECHTLIEEAFRFEGIEQPTFVKNRDEDMRRYVRESSVEIAIVELNESSDVTKDMERISHLLPNEASVVVIGKEDAISTIRNLKAMGFYYLFWPITKQELIEFLKNVHENRLREHGLGKKRQAKKVAFWGSKGGVGTSMLATEISYELSEQRKSKCVLVDHNYLGGNLDIFLNLDNFNKKGVSSVSSASDLDVTYAVSMTRKVNDMLAFLSVESDQHREHELKEYSRSLSDLLAEYNNFIVEDLSGAGQSRQDIQYIAANCDAVVIVVAPMVSCVREAKKILDLLSKEPGNLRRIVVLNHNLPANATVMTKRDVQHYLGQEVAIEIPFEPTLVKTVLNGKRLYNSRLKAAKSIRKLTSEILGETDKPSAFSLGTLLGR